MRSAQKTFFYFYNGVRQIGYAAFPLSLKKFQNPETEFRYMELEIFQVYLFAELSDRLTLLL